MKKIALVFLLLTGCSVTGIHPIKKTESFVSSIFHPSKKVDVAQNSIHSNLSVSNLSTEGIIMPSILTSAAAPEIFTTSIHWLYIGCLVAILAAAIAFYTGHILAGIKLAFSAVAGFLLGHFVSLVLGSFVFSCFVSMAFGYVLAWYIIKGKAEHSGLDLEAWINAKATVLQKQTEALSAKMKIP